MNEIYRHDKRTMSPKQISSPPPTQPRRSYENTLRTKQYQQMDARMNPQSTTARNVTPAYLPYPMGSNRSHPHQYGHFPYASSLHGVYRQSPPAVLTSPYQLHSNENRRADLRTRSQQRQLSRSASEDYYTSKYQEINAEQDEVYDDDVDDDDENCSTDLNYTFHDAGVSLHSKYQQNLIRHF